jgi:hypothetical protein
VITSHEIFEIGPDRGDNRHLAATPVDAPKSSARAPLSEGLALFVGLARDWWRSRP